MEKNTGEIPYQQTDPPDTVWLSSWELNRRANAFYEKWHFKVVGRQQFVVASDIQNDFIFRRDP